MRHAVPYWGEQLLINLLWRDLMLKKTKVPPSNTSVAQDPFQERITKVMEAFDPETQWDEISLESKRPLIAANELLKTLLHSEEEDKNKQADIIITGALIAVMTIEDIRHDLQRLYDHKYLYPICPFEPGKNEDFKELIVSLGRKALIDKKIPCDNKINDFARGVLNKPGLDRQKFRARTENWPDVQFQDYNLQLPTDTAERSKTRREEYISYKVRGISYILDRYSRPLINKRGLSSSINSRLSALTTLFDTLRKSMHVYEEELRELYLSENKSPGRNEDAIRQRFIQSCSDTIKEGKSQIKDLDWGSYLCDLLAKLANFVIEGFNTIKTNPFSFFITNAACVQVKNDLDTVNWYLSRYSEPQEMKFTR